MAQSTLTIDLNALRTNWRNLNSKTACETAVVVKADSYGLGAGKVSQMLAQIGVRKFFVALAEEGVALRQALGDGPEICVFSGHMNGDAEKISGARLTPMINSLDQMLLHIETLPGHPFGVQLDTGMNRLGMEPAEWSALREIALGQNPELVMSHLACADEPDHPMNAQQLRVFKEMTHDVDAPRSLSATGGILLGPDYHFDLCRPGIGLYGGLPFVDAQPVASLDIPVIQVRTVEEGESVGYGNTWIAEQPTYVATIAAGYADGIIRAMGPKAYVYAGEQRCKILGRISMDLIAVDVTNVAEMPETVELLGRHQSVDTLADAAGTIGYEILTSLGARYDRHYIDG